MLIASDLSIQSALAYLGCMWAGLVAVPVDTAGLRESLPGLLQNTGAKAIWVRTEDIVPQGSGSEQILTAVGDISKEMGGFDPQQRDESALAALMATSGTTGGTRFVMVTHGNLLSNTQAIVRSQHLQNEERAMLVLPIHYCFGASVLHSHLAVGGSVVFDRRFMFPDKVLRAITTYKCTTFAGVPLAYRALARRSNIASLPLPSLRRFLQAGGALDRETIQAIRKFVPKADFYVMYGQTEATARLSCLDPAELDRKLGSVGRPLDNVEVQIVNEAGEIFPNGMNGEIFVRGPSVSPGYWGDPIHTAEVFCDGWLKTGDLGHLDDEGYLWVDGRKSAFIKIRGRRIGLTEIEAKVAEVPGVTECAAVAMPHSEAGEAIGLFIVSDCESESGLEARVADALPSNWDCLFVRRVDSLPRTASGKLSRAGVSLLVQQTPESEHGHKH